MGLELVPRACRLEHPDQAKAAEEAAVVVRD